MMMITNRLKSRRETSLLESCPAERKLRGGEHEHNATMYLAQKKAMLNKIIINLLKKSKGNSVETSLLESCPTERKLRGR